MDTPFPGCPLEEAVEKGNAIERELYNPELDTWVMSTIYPTGVKSKDNLEIYVHMVTDITARKKAQEQLKVTMEQLRLTSAHLESVREEEKREIARNLHDETSQQLASLYAHIEAAIESLNKKDEKKTVALLRKGQIMATTVLDEIHNLIYELRPSIIDELGLVPAINYMAERHVKVAGIAVSIKTSGRIHRLPPSLEIALFRIIQESLNNIVRHAKATRAIISLSFKKDVIKVSVKDNGIGFNVDKVLKSREKTKAFGLLGVRERADLMDGILNINSSPGKGTEITLEVPVKMENAGG
jgi:signal transduction histidine kinase